MEKKLRMLNLQRTVAESAVESKASVKVWRDKKIKSFNVKLGELEKFNETAQKMKSKKDEVQTNEIELDEIGLRFVGLNLKQDNNTTFEKMFWCCNYCCKKRFVCIKSWFKCRYSYFPNISKEVKKPGEAKKIFEKISKKKVQNQFYFKFLKMIFQDF